MKVDNQGSWDVAGVDMVHYHLHFDDIHEGRKVIGTIVQDSMVRDYGPSALYWSNANTAVFMTDRPFVNNKFFRELTEVA